MICKAFLVSCKRNRRDDSCERLCACGHATWHGRHGRELGSDSCRRMQPSLRRSLRFCHKDVSLLCIEAGTSSLMEDRASRSRPQAKQNGSLGRRVDPNNLSRAECKVLIDAICRRSQEKGKNILTEIGERYDRRGMKLLADDLFPQPLLHGVPSSADSPSACVTGQDCNDPPLR